MRAEWCGQDNDDLDDTVYPGAPEICGNGIDNDQDGNTDQEDPDCADVDADGDGFTPNSGDCNDSDAGINPGETDTPDNGIDEDCDGLDATNMTFSKVQTEIFTPSCAVDGCHDSTAPPEGQDLSVGNAYSNTVSVPSNQSSLDRIEPGKPDESYLVHKVQGTQDSVGGSGSRMPKDGCCLSSQTIIELRNWIAHGAKNN